MRNGVITREQLFEALTFNQRQQCRIGDAVVLLGFASDAEVEAEAEILQLRRMGQLLFKHRL